MSEQGRKVTFKLLTGEKFDVECEPSAQVRQVKEIIHRHRGYAIESQKLIFQGKVLADEDVLIEKGVTEGTFVVLMVPKPKPTAEAKPAAPSPAAPAQAAAPASSGASASVPTERQVTAPAAPAEASASARQNDARADLVTQLTSMGFPEGQVRAALIAANNNPELATEFLFTGLPEEPESIIPRLPTVDEPSGGTIGSVSAAASSLGFDLNLIPEGMEAQAGWMPGSSTGGGGANPLAYLRFHPQFAQLQRLVQENPSSLDNILQELGQQSPELLEQIRQYPEAFMELLQGDFEGGGDAMMDGEEGDTDAGAGDSGASAAASGGEAEITLSEADQAAIDRLMGMMPFKTRNAVIEAFVACDRNEEMAANLLLGD